MARYPVLVPTEDQRGINHTGSGFGGSLGDEMRRIIKLRLCALCTSASLLSLVCFDACRDLDPCAAMLSVLDLLDTKVRPAVHSKACG